jgi:hypothetical protein
VSASLVVRILRRGVQRQTTPDLINHNALGSYAGLKANFFICDAVDRRPREATPSVVGAKHKFCTMRGGECEARLRPLSGAQQRRIQNPLSSDFISVFHPHSLTVPGPPLASIMQPTNRAGLSERLLHAWLVPRMTTVSPGRISASSTSVTR